VQPDPSINIFCGSSIFLNWTYTSAAIKYLTTNPEVDVVLYHHNVIEFDEVLMNPLVFVQYPVNSVTITLPNAWSPDWLGASSGACTDRAVRCTCSDCV
jgi:hypothetical protein